MEIKTPQELNLTWEKGVAWLEKTPKVPLSSLLLAGLVSQTPREEEGPSSPANTERGWSFSNPPTPFSNNLRLTHDSGTQPQQD